MTAEAKCQVKPKHGSTNFILTTGPFPQGMYYDQSDDQFICESPGSCQGYRITGCNFVRCEHAFACEGASFSNIYYLRCLGYDSCVNVTVTDTEMMHCGPRLGSTTSITTTTHRKKTPPVHVVEPLTTTRSSSCDGANIQINDKVLNCMGPGSCNAPWSHDRMVIHVGAEASVSCASSTMEQKACGNMIIEVTHGNRACIATTDLYQSCALYCEKAQDCDPDTIQFRVVKS